MSKATPTPAPAAPVFEVGDVVRLKSGGPPMTVKAVLVVDPNAPHDRPQGRYACVWFGADLGSARHDVFSAEVLKKARAVAYTKWYARLGRTSATAQ